MPVLSLRFYNKPYPYELANSMAEAGRPAYDENTPIGTEISLGPEIAQSFIAQLKAKWPEFLKVVREQQEPDSGQ